MQVITIFKEGESMKSKKIVALFVLVAMLVGLFAACGSGSSDSPASTAPASSEAQPSGGEEAPASAIAGKTVNLISSALSYDGLDAAYDQVAKSFEEATGAKFEGQWNGQFVDLIQTLQGAKISGDTYEMSSIGSGNLHQSVAKSGLVLDITQIANQLKDRCREGTMDHHTIDGHVFGIPFGPVTTMGVFYNKTMCDELGLEFPDGYTYEDFKAACAKVQAEKGITPMIQNGAAWWWWPSWFFATFAQEAGNQSIKYTEDWLRGERKFTDPEFVAAMQDIKQFFDDGLCSKDSLEADETAAVALFVQQKACFWFGTATLYVKLQNPDFEVGYMPFPVLHEGLTSEAAGGADTALNILSVYDPDDLEATVAFIEFITRPEQAGIIDACYGTFGYATAGVEGSKTEVSDAAMDLFTYHTAIYLDWIWSAEHNDAVVAAIQGIVSGEITPEEACQNVQDAYEVSVKDNDYVYDWWESWTADDWAKVTPAREVDVSQFKA